MDLKATSSLRDIYNAIEVDMSFPPTEPGVYFVCRILGSKVKRYRKKSIPFEIIYIGSSKNIRKRTDNPNHPYKVSLRDKNYITIIKSYPTPDYLAMEKAFIELFKPQWNTVGKGKLYGKG